jgi:hypothetical protein
MDAERFETLLRSLSASPSRRTALRLLAGSSLTGLLSLGSLPADAKRKKKRKGTSPTATVPPTNGGTGTPPPCTGSCEGKICGGDGCGVSCGTCDGDATCTAEGQCSCGSGRFYGCDIDFTDACGCCGMEE